MDGREWTRVRCNSCWPWTLLGGFCPTRTQVRPLHISMALLFLSRVRGHVGTRVIEMTRDAPAPPGIACIGMSARNDLCNYRQYCDFLVKFRNLSKLPLTAQSLIDCHRDFFFSEYTENYWISFFTGTASHQNTSLSIWTHISGKGHLQTGSGTFCDQFRLKKWDVRTGTEYLTLQYFAVTSTRKVSFSNRKWRIFGHFRWRRIRSKNYIFKLDVTRCGWDEFGVN